MNDYIVFGRPALGKDHIQAVTETLESNWIGRGPKVSAFENDLKNFTKQEHAVAVSSCTAALHLAAECLNLSAGDEILVPALTFAATANAMLYTGAKVKFIDSAPGGYCLDPKNLPVGPETKAAVAVHMHGERCDVKALHDAGLKVIEDAAHALELESLGQYSEAVCFSFYASKNITTIEGGALTSRSADFVARARVLSQHGLSSDAWTRYSTAGFKHYLVTELGYKYNMTDVQAALGSVELKHLPSYQRKRRRLWEIYSRELENTGLALPRGGYDHALHLYAPRIESEKFTVSRDELMHALHEKRIGTGVHYLSLCEHPYYQRALGVNPETCPNAMKVGRETFSLPFSQYVSDDQAAYICDTLKALTQKHRR